MAQVAVCHICGRKGTDSSPLDFVAYWRIKGEDVPVWLHYGNCMDKFNS